MGLDKFGLGKLGSWQIWLRANLGLGKLGSGQKWPGKLGPGKGAISASFPAQPTKEHLIDPLVWANLGCNRHSRIDGEHLS